MAQPASAAADSFTGNPFSTRHTRPGRIIPLTSDGRPRDTAALLDSLAALGGWAAIRGPHGSGKTTLLAHLAEGLELRGVPVSRVRLRSWRDAPVPAVRDIVSAWRMIVRCPAGGTVCIDSWEQMGAAAARLATLLARVKRCGLLVTTHHDTHLPLLVACETTPALLASIVRRLPGSEGWADSVIAGEDINATFVACGGNVRDALSMLYDRFENRKRQS